MLQRKTIMILDPSPNVRQRLKEAVYENETLVDVVEAESVDQATGMLRYQLPDVVFTEIDLPLEEGGRLIASIKGMAPESRIIVITGNDSEECRTAAMQYGADDFLIREDAVGLRLIDLIHEAVRGR